MSNYTIELFPDEPILMVRVTPEYSISKDMPKSEVEERAILDASDRRLYFLLDLLDLSISLEEVVFSSNLGGRGRDIENPGEERVPLWHHPNIIQNVMVSRNPLLKLASKGLSTKVFGNLDVKVVDTVEEGLAYIREQLSQ